MGYRLSKIYTKTGDKGTTGLGDGARVDKDDCRITSYGTVDELNSFIGLLLADDIPESITQQLLQIQNDLFDLGGELCIPNHIILNEAYSQRLETWIDTMNENLQPLKNFILPSGSHAAALAHVIRTIARRAERHTVSLTKQATVNPCALQYLNRLSDYFFVLARTLLKIKGHDEILWQPPIKPSE